MLTKAVLGIQQLVNQFAKGDRHARRDVFQYAALLGVDLQAKEIIAEALGVRLTRRSWTPSCGGGSSRLPRRRRTTPRQGAA